MESAPYGHALGGGVSVGRVRVKVDKTLLEKMEALPDRVGHMKGRTWTPEEDAALLAGWPVKRHDDVARMLGVSRNTAQRRYEELTEART